MPIAEPATPQPKSAMKMKLKLILASRGEGLYQVRITKEGLTEDDLDEIADALGKRTGLIGFVSVSD